MNRSRNPLGARKVAVTLTPIVLAAVALVPSVAHAQTKLATVEVDTVVDLGSYDTTTSKHPAYAISALPMVTLSSANCPAPSATYDWERAYVKQDEFGNGTFGAGYSAGLTFTSRAGRGNERDTFTGEGLLSGYVTVFGSDREVARISGKASMTGSQGTSSYYVRLMGVNVRSKSVTGNLSGNEALVDAALFSASTTIWLGPLPVKFTGAVKGNVGINYLAQYATSTLSVTATPSAELSAVASASIDVYLASAGVTGTLSLVKAGVPARAAAVVAPNSVSYSLDADLRLTSLSGRIDAWAHIPGKTWRLNLANWSPLYQGTYPIVHVLGCQNPIVRPVCGDAVCASGESYTNCPSDCVAPPPVPPSDEPPLPIYCNSKPWLCTNL
ncbi:MAG: hypothetical protein U0235_15855 [Polyangiaceae bacterium]